MENEHDEIEQHFLESMLDTVEYMDKIIAKSLELYRLEERDKKSLRKEEIHVEEIISDVLVKYAEVLKERGLKAKMQGEHSLIADYTVFENIITNIISNISKYAKENSEFLITIESKRITFSNVIEEEITVSENELFTPFVKGNKSRTGQNGTGLGLSIVKALCELQGYRVSITVIDGNFVLIIS